MRRSYERGGCRRNRRQKAVTLYVLPHQRLFTFDVLVYTVGDRAFPVAAAHLWNSLPSQATTAPPLSPSSAVSPLKSHLFSLSYPAF